MRNFAKNKFIDNIKAFFLSHYHSLRELPLRLRASALVQSLRLGHKFPRNENKKQPPLIVIAVLKLYIFI